MASTGSGPIRVFLVRRPLQPTDADYAVTVNMLSEFDIPVEAYQTLTHLVITSTKPKNCDFLSFPPPFDATVATGILALLRRAKIPPVAAATAPANTDAEPTVAAATAPANTDTEMTPVPEAGPPVPAEDAMLFADHVGM